MASPFTILQQALKTEVCCMLAQGNVSEGAVCMRFGLSKGTNMACGR